MGKVLVSASHFDTLCKDAWKLLEENGHEVIYDPNRKFPSYSYEELQTIIPDIDAALIGMDNYNEDVFKIAPKLKAVAKFGVGVDNIDGEAAKKYGIKVINAPGQNSNAVAELTVAFIIDILRGVTFLDDRMRMGEWPRYLGTEIKGKMVGLLGFGAISRLVAKKLKAFDVNVQAFDLYPNRQAADELGVIMTDMETVITKSDIVSLHIPATKETYHLFDDEMFAKMREGSYLVNAARGALVDIDALARALFAGHLKGAALDAFETEPLPADSAILRCENVVLTPHTGAESKEAYENVSLSTCKDIVAVLAGKDPVFWTNK